MPVASSSSSHLEPVMPTTSLSSPPIVLTIAGSDSGGGAGIQADIKTISATGSYACSAITAITSQNTLGVSAILPIPIKHIESQLDAIFCDLNVAAVKIGMLADSQIIHAVADKLRQYHPPFVVLDPVMVATSGDVLLQNEAINHLKQHLFPLATVITPNLPEAAVLTGVPLPKHESELSQLVDALQQLAYQAALLKGGHFTQSPHSNDWLITKQQVHCFSADRIQTSNTHGTGCTLSSAITSYLAQGQPLEQAIHSAKHYISQALFYADQLHVGQGHGPVHHFYEANPTPLSSIPSILEKKKR
ncbi:bifunctional hydroxymethylpyrimidine kinase/phosphomethylpyrimidine kinase [Vibrio cincinnatiensis]|uniref:bifunctional hydroxymethylpyrimidine kinase/phosphomethylpyrimidine kinase n=1 Tax=Vibrio cincinnatiensis TaxID=675 RepID=UPI003B96A801